MRDGVDADSTKVEDVELGPCFAPVCVGKQAFVLKKWTESLFRNDIYTTEDWAAIRRRWSNEQLIDRYGELLVARLDELSGIAPAVAPAAPAGACAIACRPK